MRIGELLLERSWVHEVAVATALAEQRSTGERLCTLLVARGYLDYDHAARALAEQHGVPPALTRHLVQRDAELVQLLPAELARQLLAVPIGRGKGGELVVCVRDPVAATHTALTAATKMTIVLAVAAEGLLARTVAMAYAKIAHVAMDPPTIRTPIPRAQSEAEEFEVDLSTGLIPKPQDLPLPRVNTDDIPFANFALVELDDIGVTKDHAQSSGQFTVPAIPRTMTPARPAPPPPPPDNDDLDLPIELPGSRSSSSQSAIQLPESLAVPRRQTREVPAARGPTLRETLAELERTTSRDDAEEVAMAFVTARWGSSILFQINEGAALGHRGHGASLSGAMVEAAAVPLGAPSIVNAAYQSKKLATATPAGAGMVQTRLTALLGHAAAPVAAPVLLGGHVAYVLVVGDPQGDPIGTDRAELDKLCAALGAAYGRIVQGAERSS